MGGGYNLKGLNYPGRNYRGTNRGKVGRGVRKHLFKKGEKVVGSNPRFFFLFFLFKCFQVLILKKKEKREIYNKNKISEPSCVNNVKKKLITCK